MNVATVPLGCVLPVRGMIGSVPPILPPIGLVVVAVVVPILPVVVLVLIALVELCPALAELVIALLDELAFVNEFRTALVELVATFCELVALVLATAGEKLVGTNTLDPPTVNTPLDVPVVALVGIVDPENGMNLPPWIVPPIALVAPAGVNVANVPLGTFPPVNVINDISVPPRLPVIGVWLGAPIVYEAEEFNIALVELCPALAEELAFVNEFRTALVEL